MSNCAVCSTKLKFTNTPTFGSGKLNDGNVICTFCYKKVNKVNHKMAFKLKNYSLDDVNDVLNSTFGEANKIIDHIKTLSSKSALSCIKRKEINELPQILSEGETIDNLVQGSYNDGIGILVSTNKRLIFIDKGMVYGLKVEDFPLDKISSIQYETGLLLGKIKIHTSSNSATIENVDKGHVREFSEFVRAKIDAQANNEAKIVKQETDVYDKLEKLGMLKESGVLSEEEFVEQKAKLLSEL